MMPALSCISMAEALRYMRGGNGMRKRPIFESAKIWKGIFGVRMIFLDREKYLDNIPYV